MRTAVGNMYDCTGSHLLSFFGLIVLLQPVCLAFNIDTADPSIYYGDGNGFFGHKVLQVSAGEDKGILVTASLQQNGSGTVCRYMTHANSCFTPQEAMPGRLFGWSIAEEPTLLRLNPGPVITHDLQPPAGILFSDQDCTKKTVDLVFLFDGSGSITRDEFNQSKEFILDIMNSIKNSSIKFAAVQFSSKPRKVFDFNDYHSGEATKLLRNEPFMQSLTNTYRALQYTLDELFENQAAGASPDATKVLVTITDGDPSDRDRNGIVKKYDEKEIIRLVIGVKRVKLDTLYALASEPKTVNTFHINNYNGLAGILKNFEEKIFNIEDSRTALSEKLQYEMSQSGFSSVYHKGALVLGSVGSKDWRGSLYERDGAEPGIHIEDPDMKHSSYMDSTKKTVDLVFLFDGSASMTRDEFNQSKEFILDIMNSIKNSSIKFAAVQFSFMPRKVFDFNDYHSGEATKLLRNEPFMQSLTNMYQALQYTLDELFENQAAGASPDATKVLVTITDGDPSDRDMNGIVKKYDEKEIIRLVIGVKRVKLDTLYALASEPKTNNTFHINNYNGLAGILKNFEEKIFNIEDSRTALSEKLQYEMSQSGFSSVYHKGALVLGLVGSKDCRGSLYERNGAEPGIHIEDPDMKHSSYMGYSVAAGEKDSVSLYFTGAPWYKHTGEVVVFRKTDNTWNVLQRVTGEQIGSYFGAELCLVDVQSDGHVDFLLVGAPMFHYPQEKREGQIYIYKLTKKLELESVLNVTVPSRGRFGTTVSSLADLNGDGLRDVAVGAPLEDDLRGAVYIYLGHQHTGIRPAFSQRITADPGNARIRFFGQAVDGSGDLGEDGLADLVVGSRGAVVVLRSKPVVNVKARLLFKPAEISTASIQCPNTQTGAALPMVVLTVCFDLAEVTRSRTGTTTTGLNISYSLDMDPLITAVRGFFSETGKRDLHQTVELATKHCFNHSVSMPFCVYDTLSPVVIRLNYTQHESEKAANILNADSATQTATEVPFEKN
ncbi:integrin alpha-L-like [Gadus macrocephalus]|uniref:integrin alpha-L-like n=1 Tax=Gadus macrocephalus TaxID=80720 RepID=UPI0028CBBF97|nr:integrin alpha-L-like [Gadus macrocephalus]